MRITCLYDRMGYREWGFKEVVGGITMMGLMSVFYCEHACNIDNL